MQTHSRCNADCVFCPYVESAHAAAPGVMSDALWQEVLENLRPFTAINEGKFCPYLMQEPLLDKSIFAKIADIYRSFPGTCVEVSTNGAALTERVCERLFELFEGRRHELWISHHGTSEATLQHIMRIDYERATANVIAALRMAKGRFRIKLRGAGESHDGKHTFFTAAQYREHWARVFDDHGIDRRNVVVDAFRFHDRAATLHRADRDARGLNMGTVREIDAQHPFACGRIDEWIHIMFDGTIRICCMDYHGEVKLPNVRSMPLQEYFRSAAYATLTDNVSGRTASPPNFICKRCTSPGG